MTLLWEYSLQFAAAAEFPALVAEYWKELSIGAVLREITTQLTREKATANDMDVTMD